MGLVKGDGAFVCFGLGMSWVVSAWAFLDGTRVGVDCG